jgi:hypothetical protein
VLVALISSREIKALIKFFEFPLISLSKGEFAKIPLLRVGVKPGIF